jgi:hypothetical protein
MNLDKKIKEAYPEVTDELFHPLTGSILLQDDGDGIQYIAKWEYSKPLPDGMKVGKN